VLVSKSRSHGSGETILLLEDKPLTRRALESLFHKRFPDAKIETAETDEEALKILDSYQHQGINLDVAVLDFLVPSRRGTNPEVSSVCTVVNELHPETLVIHFTAYLSDEGVTKHIATYHSDYESSPTARPVNKLSKRWEEDLCGRIATYFVARQMKSLAESKVTAGRGSRRTSQRHQGATFRRAVIVRDVARYWKLLEPELKERVRRYFDVDETEEPVIVR
jgi:DNA-binding NarL/FixJ family response regulator